MQRPGKRVRLRFALAGSSVLSAAFLLLGFIPATAQACSWTGTWRRLEGTGTAVVTLTQTGNEVTGDDGVGDPISGTVSGNRFTGRWSHGSDGGALELTMDASCNRLSGTFGWAPPRAPDPFTATRLSGAPRGVGVDQLDPPLVPVDLDAEPDPPAFVPDGKDRLPFQGGGQLAPEDPQAEVPGRAAARRGLLGVDPQLVAVAPHDLGLVRVAHPLGVREAEPEADGRVD